MAKTIKDKKPLTGNKRSHALNATKMQQKPNFQSKVIDGVKVKLSARGLKTLNKKSKSKKDVVAA